jgi:hypothetical protein
MKTKIGSLLIISLLAVLCGGCGTGASPSSENLYPLSPSFSQDSTPAPPKFHWLTSRPYTTDDTARQVYVPRG